VEVDISEPIENLRSVMCDEAVLEKENVSGVKFLYSEAPISILQEKKRKIVDCLVKIGKNTSVEVWYTPPTHNTTNNNNNTHNLTHNNTNNSTNNTNNNNSTHNSTNNTNNNNNPTNNTNNNNSTNNTTHTAHNNNTTTTTTTANGVIL